MGLLFLMSAWLCGGSVERLGSATFHERQTAHERLRSLGWVAYPALFNGFRSDNPERAGRCGELLDGLESTFLLAVELEGVARGVMSLPDGVSDEYMAAVCRRVDRLGGWKTSEAWAWVKATPYQHGTRRADCEYAVRTAMAKRAVEHLFPPLVPGLTTK